MSQNLKTAKMVLGRYYRVLNSRQSGVRFDHWCQVLWKSVKGFRSYRTPKRHLAIVFLKVSFVKIVFSFRTNYETFPLACFWNYYVSCACIVESCACQLYIKRIYDDDFLTFIALTTVSALPCCTVIHVRDMCSNRVFTRSSKRPASARVFLIHLLEVCWTFASWCKRAIK